MTAIRNFSTKPSGLHNLAAAQEVIDRDTKTDEDLKNQINEARAGYEGRPSTDEMGKLQADVDQLQKQLNDANVKLTTANAELARLQGTGATTGGATTAPSVRSPRMIRLGSYRLNWMRSRRRSMPQRPRVFSRPSRRGLAGSVAVSV